MYYALGDGATIVESGVISYYEFICALQSKPSEGLFMLFDLSSDDYSTAESSLLCTTLVHPMQIFQ
jgi:hypothetical protein